jgi:pimeloyl-ACP methyl ester carboxylesterase
MTQVHYPFPVRYIGVDGIDMAYCDEGSGSETILFVHGLGNYLGVWHKNMLALSARYRCIAVDLPGNGLSSRGDYPYSMFFYAEALHRFCEALALEKVVVAGHSMGGQVSLVLALRYPELVEKMVLVSSSGIEYFSETDKIWMHGLMSVGEFLYSDELHLEAAIRQSYYRPDPDADNIVSDLKTLMREHPYSDWRRMVNASVRGMLNDQVNRFLPEIRCPVLIIAGKNDAMVPNRLLHLHETPESLARKAQALFPRATVKLLDGCGHFAQLEKPGEVNEAILSFVG